MPALQRLMTRLVFRLPEAMLMRMVGGTPTEVAGRTLSPALQLITAEAAKQPAMWTLPVAGAREAGDAGMQLLNGTPRRMQSIDRIEIPGPGGPIPLRIYRPVGLSADAPLVLYFHQGGFVIGNPDWCEAFCTLLADTARCVVASVTYRLAPEHRFPAAHEDALAVWSWAQKSARDVGGDSARLIVAGESAGGNLAAVLAHHARRSGGNAPVLQLLIFPWVGGREELPSIRDFAGAYPLSRELLEWFQSLQLEDPTHADDPRLNPLDEEDFTGLAPAIVATAGFDPICDQGAAYADKLRAAGVDVTYRCYDALCHSFTSMGAVPAVAQAQREIAEGLARALQSA